MNDATVILDANIGCVNCEKVEGGARRPGGDLA